MIEINERKSKSLGSGDILASFEFFPPKTDEGVHALFEVLLELVDLEPGFVSVTYGAGGSTRQRTLDLVSRIKRETGIEAMSHLTCVGHSRDELLQMTAPDLSAEADATRRAIQEG